MKNKKVTKAIITAAGFGTRFLPTTKSVPKEMIPILEYPTIHYVVQELVESGITDLIVVTRKAMPATMSYFESNMEVEDFLEKGNKDEILQKVRELNNRANFSFINQDPTLPYGSGSPILSAKQWVGDDDFAIVYCDDVVLSKTPATKQLLDLYYENDNCDMVISAQEVPWEEVHKYATVEFKENSDNRLERLIEKPKREDAKTNLVYYGRHICSNKLFNYLDPEKVEEGKEFFLSECIDRMAKEEEVLVKKVDGDWCTTGDPLNLLKASLKFALDRDDMKDNLNEFLNNLSRN